MTVWVVVSREGYPAPLFGWAFRKKQLEAQYHRLTGQTLQADGYRAIKADLVFIRRPR